MIVIFGSMGQLGRALQQQIGEFSGHIFLHRKSQDYCGDVANMKGITETLLELKPDIVINASGYTAVDQAENDVQIAEQINTIAPAIMAQISAKIDALFIHYSTDYVFDGLSDEPYTENDFCQPLSVYGKTKLQGEKEINQNAKRYFIIRTSWLYSIHGNNFLKTILSLSQIREELSIVNDQWGTPTHVNVVANATLDLINLATPGFGSERDPPKWGTYHCAARGETTWFKYADLIVKTAKTMGMNLKIKECREILTKDYPSIAKRPFNSRLNTAKLETTLGNRFPDWEEDVVLTVGSIIAENKLDI